MGLHHAAAGEVIDVRPLQEALGTSKTEALFKSERLEAIRLVMAAGKEIAEHRAPGEITVQCLEGRVLFNALGKTQELVAGKLLHLPSREPHSLRALEDSSLLVTIAFSP